MIVPFEKEHLPLLLDHLVEWIKEYPIYKDYHVDRAYTSRYLNQIIDNVQGSVLIQDEDTKGVLLYALAPTFFSPVLEASELAFFIHPEYRSYRNAVSLIKSATTQAFCLGAVRITLGNSSGHRADSINKLYSRLGFSFIGGSHYKDRS